MKNLLLSLLTFIFPHERRAHRVANLTEHDLSPLLAIKNLSVQDMDVRTLFSYKEPLIRDVIWALKYEKNRHAAQLLGTLFAETLLEELSEDAPFQAQPPLLIPIPLSRARESGRGYNQTLWIAESAMTTLGNTIKLLPQTLKRVRSTTPQTALPREQRLTNVRGAFHINEPESVRNRTCILLDDVVTTGSTLREARETLRNAGAVRVDCWAMAASGS